MQPTKNNHIAGLDYLRAFFSVAVVLWHMHALGTSKLFYQKEYVFYTLQLSDIINFHILLTAVPAFLLISCFLFALKQPDLSYLKKQLKRILILLIFWAPVYLIYRGGIQQIIKLKPDNIIELTIIIFSAGQTIYYFFVVLLLLIVITYVGLSQNIKSVYASLGIFTVYLFVLPHLSLNNNNYILNSYWNPLNFLPYPLAAILISKYKVQIENSSKLRMILIASLVTVSTLLALYEWNTFISLNFFEGTGVAFPVYKRASLVFITSAILIFFLNPKIKSNKVIRFMAKYSLALYCLHPFAMTVSSYLNPAFLPFIAVQIIKILVVILVSYLLAFILSKIIRNDLLF